MGPLGRRLLLAFGMVAVASIIVVTAAALIGTTLGINAASQRQDTADAVADQAAKAFASQEGWDGAPLAPAFALADDSGTTAIIRSLDGHVIASSAGGDDTGHMGSGQGAMAGPNRNSASADVIVDGVLVGTVRVGFGSREPSEGRTIAWAWILVAALASLVIAASVALATARWITAPIARLAVVAREFAKDNRSIRPAAKDTASTTELGDLSRAFYAAADDVERSEITRRRMASDVAHELRTPLTVLQAGLEELRDGYVAADHATVAALHEQSLRLGRVVEDLAILSAAESSAFTLHISAIDLGDLVEEAVLAARPTFDSASITLTSSTTSGLDVRADADRLHQALGNLLTNAVRYCPAGSTVEVVVRTSEAMAILEVRDDGPGIAPADQVQVFDRFWRGTFAAETAPRGSGIGMAVVKEIIEAHHGSVELTSDGISGSTFTIRLPLNH